MKKFVSAGIVVKRDQLKRIFGGRRASGNCVCMGENWIECLQYCAEGGPYVHGCVMCCRICYPR